MKLSTIITITIFSLSILCTTAQFQESSHIVSEELVQQALDQAHILLNKAPHHTALRSPHILQQHCKTTLADLELHGKKFGYTAELDDLALILSSYLNNIPLRAPNLAGTGAIGDDSIYLIGKSLAISGTNIDTTAATIASTAVATQLALAVTGSAAFQGNIILQSASSGYVGLTAPTITSPAYTLQLPINAGTDGYVLQTDGTGILTWTSKTSSSITGSFYQQGGNSFATTGTLGLVDNNSLNIITNNTLLARFNADGTTEFIPAVSGTDALRSLTISQGTSQSQSRIMLAAGGSDTDVSISLIPSGTGALLVASPDGTAVGGNQRGTYAIDLQIQRQLATQVASGSRSVISGGRRNTASGTESTVSGGSGNIASGGSTVVSGGTQNTASGSSSAVIGGDSNVASGGNATVIGGLNNTAAGVYSAAGGLLANVSAQGSFAWADSSPFAFNVTTTDQFAVRVANGLLITADSSSGELRLQETPSNGSNYIALKAPADLSADYTYTLPSDYGLAGQVLSTDGNGILTWTTASSSVISGSFYQQGGNSFATTGTLGLLDNNSLNIITNNTLRARFNADGTTEFIPAVSGTDALRSLTITQGTGQSQSRIILAAGGSDADVSISLIPSGTGALLVASPDGTNLGGNQRGVYAIDLQIQRQLATQVASGSRSVISGGRRNTASGPESTVSGGSGNIASGGSTVVSGGAGNTASGNASAVIGGDSNVASGGNATVIGGLNNTAAGVYSAAGGLLANVSAQGSFAWADSSPFAFNVTTTDQFAVRVANGLLITAESSSGELRLQETPSNGSNYIALKAPAELSADYTYTLPSNYGLAGQVLSTDGTGILTWSSAGTTGITSINELTASAQYLTTSTTTTFLIPQFSEVTSNTHELQLPMAHTPGVLAGLISHDEFDAFSTATSTLLTSSFYQQGGNSFATTGTLGLTDNNNLNIITNNAARIAISNTGNVVVNAPTSGVALTVNGAINSTAATITSGAVTTQLALAITGSAQINGNTTLLNNGEVRLGDNTTNYIALKSPLALSTNYTYTLPANYGTNAAVLTTNGNGLLSWTDQSVALSGTFYKQGGNSFATTGTLGLNDANDLIIITNGTMRARFNSNGSTEITPTVSGTSAIRSLTITQANDFSQPRIIEAVGGTDTNVSLCLVPRGTGALITANPDGTLVGGGRRGNAAVDLQLVRTNSSQVASGNNSFLGNGVRNTASGDSSAVVAGATNVVSGASSFVGAGNNNNVNNFSSAIVAGTSNTNSSITSGFIGAGFANNLAGSYSGIVSGHLNSVTKDFSLVGGGLQNTASGIYSVAPGGFDNTASGDFSFAAGRQAKATAQGSFAWADSTAADFNVTTTNSFNVRANSEVNFALETSGTNLVKTLSFFKANNLSQPRIIEAVGGTDANISLCLVPCGTGALITASPDGTTSGGNRRGDYAVDLQLLRNAATQVASGSNSVISGGQANTATGIYATVPGGFTNTASADFSFAAGRQAKATAQGSFAWADSRAADFNVTTTDLFAARANGGFRFTLADTAQQLVITNSTNNNAFVGIGMTSPYTQLVVPGGTMNTAATLNVGSYPSSIYVQGRYAYVANFTSATLNIVDVSNSNSPLITGTVSTGNLASVYVQGRYAYGADYWGPGLQIIDISNPSNPIFAGSITTVNERPNSVYVQGKYAYVANSLISGPGSLQIIDISNPSNLISISSVSINGAVSVYVQGTYAYVAEQTTSTLKVVNVTNPANPFIVGSVSVGTAPNYLYIQGRYAYVVNTSELKIIDIKNPASPAVVSTLAVGTAPFSVYVQGRYAYILNQNSATLQIVDVSNPLVPTSIQTIGTGSVPQGLFVQGRYAYITNAGANTISVIDLTGAYIQQLEVGGLEVGTFQTRENMTVNGDLDITGGITMSRGFNATAPSSIGTTNISPNPNFTSASLSSLAPSGRQPQTLTSLAYTSTTVGATATTIHSVIVQGNRTYVLYTDTGATTTSCYIHIYDTSTPTNPIALNSPYVIIVGASAITTMRMVVQQNYLYITDRANSRLFIVDVSAPSAPNVVSTTNLTAVTSAQTNPEDIVVQNTYAFILSSGGTVRVGKYDISNPAAPTQIGVGAPGGANYVGGRLALNGNLIYVMSTAAATGIERWDASSNSLTFINNVATSANPRAITLEGNFLYVLLADGTLALYNINNYNFTSAAPVAGGTLALGSNTQNIKSQGNYLYASDTSARTIRIIRITNQTSSGLAVVATRGINMSPAQFTVQGNYVYIGGTTSGNEVLQVIENGTTITSQPSISINGGLPGLAIDDGAGNFGTALLGDRLVVNGTLRLPNIVTNLQAISDKRVKENIHDLNRKQSLDAILQLQPKTFTYTPAWQEKNNVGPHPTKGFIAQEVQEILPDMVTCSPETEVGDEIITNMLSVSPVGLLPDLVAAVQGMHDDYIIKIATLEQQVQKQSLLIEHLMNHIMNSTTTAVPA